MNQFPLVDPISLPGPVWLFKALHLLTMALHFSAMYFLVGGLIITVLWQLRGRLSNDPLRLDASGVVAQRLPIVTAFVINLGIPPLLFAQVLYGRALYTSSVLIGVFWISVIFLLMAAYYLLYRMAQRAEKGLGYWLAGIIALLLILKIAYIYSTNMTLMLRPDRWQELYRTNPYGATLAGGDPTTLPRWAFMMAGAVSVSGIMLLWLSLKKSINEATALHLRKCGGLMLAIFGVAQVLLAFWVISTQPEAVKAELGGLFTTLGGAWLLVTALMVLMGFMVIRGSCGCWKKNTVASLVAFVNILLMTCCRDILRDISLMQYNFDVYDRVVYANWPVIGIFLLLFVIAVVLVLWMAMVAIRAKEVEEHYG